MRRPERGPGGCLFGIEATFSRKPFQRASIANAMAEAMKEWEHLNTNVNDLRVYDGS